MQVLCENILLENRNKQNSFCGQSTRVYFCLLLRRRIRDTQYNVSVRRVRSIRIYRCMQYVNLSVECTLNGRHRRICHVWKIVFSLWEKERKNVANRPRTITIIIKTTDEQEVVIFVGLRRGRGIARARGLVRVDGGRDETIKSNGPPPFLRALAICSCVRSEPQ